MLAAVPAQGQVIQSGVELLGDPPETIPLDVKNTTSFTIRYHYLNGAGADESSTDVHISVQDKPEWLTVVHPETVQVPVDSTEQSTNKTVPISFFVDDRLFPAGLRTHTVTMHVRAEQNGQIKESENTFSWITKAEYVPDVSLTAEPKTLRMQGDHPHRITVTLQNFGNARIQPSFRLTRIPTDIQTHVAYSNSVVSFPEMPGGDPGVATASIVLRDQGASWTQEFVEVQASYYPAIDSTAGTDFETLQVGIIRESGPWGAVLFGTTVVALVVGGALYLRRRDAPRWHGD